MLPPQPQTSALTVHVENVLHAAPMARSKSKHNRDKMRRKIKHKQRTKRRKAALKAQLKDKKPAAPKGGKK